MVVILTLLGCAGADVDCDDACLSERAAALIAEDYGAGLAALKAIEDPLFATAAVMEIMRRPDVYLEPPHQVRAVCEVAVPATATLCEERFVRVHLISALRQEQDGDAPLGGHRSGWDDDAPGIVPQDRGDPNARGPGGPPHDGPPPDGPPPGAPAPPDGSPTEGSPAEGPGDPPP